MRARFFFNYMSPSVSMCVDPGVCKFKTKITTTYDDGVIVFEMVTDCPYVKKLPEVLKDGLDPFEALKMPFSSNPVYDACGKVLAHSACPIPSAMIKTVEAAAGLGLKRPVRFDFDC